MSAVLPIAVVGSLALASELRGRPTRPGASGSASSTQRLGGVLLLTAAATAAVPAPRLASASVEMPSRGRAAPPDDLSLWAPQTPALEAVESPASPAAPPPVATGSGDDAFYQAVLRGIGAPWNGATQRFVYAWRQAEGGSARYNPFNTTQRMTGSVAYNRVGVQSYPDAATGVAATVKTLLNGRYAGLVSALRAGASVSAMADALAASPWGTGGLAKKVLAAQDAGAPARRVAIAVAPGQPPISSMAVA